jgi:hypothetical protein
VRHENYDGDATCFYTYCFCLFSGRVSESPTRVKGEMVAVGIDPKSMSRPFLDLVRESTGTSLPLVQCAEVPKVEAQLWTHVYAKSSGAPSWIVRLCLKSDNLQTKFKKSSYRIVPRSFLNGREYGNFVSC